LAKTVNDPQETREQDTTAAAKESESKPLLHTGRPDPRSRPYDPAGTRPRHEPDDLLPTAGLPAPQMALTAASFVAPQPAAAEAAPAAETPSGSAGSLARAQLIIGGLVALGVVAAAGLAIALTRPGSGPPVPWSTWQPGHSDVDPAIQIAQHIEPEYLQGGLPLVQITGSPLTIGGVPGALALLQSNGNVQPYQNNVVIYQLQGTGANGSIAGGSPSTARFLLLSREALELALYTFRYVSGVNAVVVTIPPPPPSATGASSSTASSSTSSQSSTTSALGGSSSTTAASAADQRALLFRPEDLTRQLSQPLAATLSGPAPSVQGMTTSTVRPLLDRLTTQQLYSYFIDTANASIGPVLVLSPPGVGG
jgi:hypothetical protein